MGVFIVLLVLEGLLPVAVLTYLLLTTLLKAVKTRTAKLFGMWSGTGTKPRS
jgi:hypothetical protein